MIKLLPILLLFLFSCKTVKEVTKEVVKYDSAAIKENKALRMFLSEEIERFEKDREAWENTGVVFDTDTITNTVTKIIFDNGKIKSIEGRVKSLNQSLYEKSSELLDAHSTIDSMGVELEKKEVELSKKQSVVVKEKKVTVTPWWIWLLLAIGWIGRGYWPRISGFIMSKFFH